MVLMAEISQIKQTIGCNQKTQVNQNQQGNNIFEEFKSKKFEGNKNEP
ncbi:hypothetical protein [Desulfosporosinus sp. BICA1-9]|nr:hypothetical protein [Desulfosporosinus sp. BICA1-9]